MVSPDSIGRDYRYKRSEYAALEVLEYWILEHPLEAKLTLLMWEEGWYEETVLTGTQAIASPTFLEMSLTVEATLAAGSQIEN